MTKSPKKVSDNKQKQTKITDQWVLKKTDDIKEISKSNKKQTLKRKAESIELPEKEHECDDNEIIKSSQNVSESNLRIKIQKTIESRARTPKSTPKKVRLTSPSSVIDKLSISEQEINDIYEGIDEKEPIEMTHDVETLITSDKLSSNVLTYSPSKVCLIKIEPLENHIAANELTEDPLKLNVSSENNLNISEEKRIKKQRNAIKKKIEKNKKSDVSSPQKSDMPKAILKKLKELKVELQHEVPPQHLIEGNSSIHRHMSKEQILEFESFGPLKKGPYTANEDKIIKENYENFCKIHNWDPKIYKPFIKLKDPNNNRFYMPSAVERKNFVQFLANGLPWRSLSSIFQRFKNLYDTNFETGKYSLEDDKLILNYLATVQSNNMKNYVQHLAKKLNRKTMSVWHRYQKLKAKYNLLDENYDDSEENSRRKVSPVKKINIVKKRVTSNVKWTYPVVKKFVDTLLKVTQCKNVNDLKNKEIDEEMWEQVELKTAIVSSILKNFWNNQLYMQLFCPKPIYLNDFKIEFIKYLYELQPKKIEDIDWRSACLKFDGTTPSFLSLLFNNLVKSTQERINSCDIYETIQFLHDKHIPELMERKTDALLPTLDSKLRVAYKISEQKLQNSTLNNPLRDDDY